MNCDHDQKRYGLIGLPKEAHGCLACAYEQSIARLAAAQSYITTADAALDDTHKRLVKAVAALRAIEPFIPITSAAEGGAAKFSANVRAADQVRAVLRAADSADAALAAGEGR